MLAQEESVNKKVVKVQVTSYFLVLRISNFSRQKFSANDPCELQFMTETCGYPTRRDGSGFLFKTRPDRAEIEPNPRSGSFTFCRFFIILKKKSLESGIFDFFRAVLFGMLGDFDLLVLSCTVFPHLWGSLPKLFSPL